MATMARKRRVRSRGPSGRRKNTKPGDADDPRRQRDQMAPPREPCECSCLHCHRVFTSDGIWFQRIKGDPSGFEGYWMRPTPNCDGAGFTFDIFPTDPDHPANAGWHSFGDDEEGENGEDGEDGEEAGNGEGDEAWDEEDDDSTDGAEADAEGSEWDPAEPEYQDADADRKMMTPIWKGRNGSLA